MERLADLSRSTLDSVNHDVSIKPLCKAIEPLLALDALQRAVPFWQHPAWWQLANEALFDNRLELVRVTNTEGKMLAALPVRRSGGLLQSPKHDHLTVLESLWCEPSTADSIDRLMASVLTQLNGWAWQSNNSPDDACIRSCEHYPHWHWRQARESAWFDTAGDMPIPGKLRRNLTRHARNLESTHGAVRYCVTSNAPSDTYTNETPHQTLQAALDTFLALESAGWKGASGTAINHDPTLQSFYQGMQRLHDRFLEFEIHELKLADRCIASQLAFRCKDTRYLLKICYNEEFASFSPGSQLLKYTLEHCVQSPITRLSLVSAPQWAMRWKPHVLPVWQVTRYADSPQGHIRRRVARTRRTAIQQVRAIRLRKPS